MVVPAVQVLASERELQHLVGKSCQPLQLLFVRAEVVASLLDAVRKSRNPPGDRTFQTAAAPHRFQVEVVAAAEMIVESYRRAVAAGQNLQTELPAAVAETVAAAFGLRWQTAAVAGLHNSRTDLAVVAEAVAADQKQQNSAADQNLQSFVVAVVVAQVADQALQSFVAAAVAAVQRLQSFAAALSATIQSLPERRPVVAAADSIR